MTKKSKSQLAIFTVLVVVTATTFFYFKDFFITLPASQLNNLEKISTKLPSVEELAKKIDENISMPEPIRARIQEANTYLTASGSVKWTNIHRQQNGLAVLKVNDQLVKAARLKLNDMFTDQYFDHVSPTGKGPSYWIDQAGYTYIESGENLAEGNFATDEKLVQAWMDSPGHRENILTPSFEEIGIAVAEGTFEGRSTWLAVQMFGRPKSSCPEVNDSLSDEIDSLKIELDILELDVQALASDLESSKPKGHSSSEEINAYNEIVRSYNEAANKYNALLEEVKRKISNYNSQVNTYNACAEN